MKTPARKSTLAKRNSSQVNEVSRSRRGLTTETSEHLAVEFVDNRPGAIAQLKLQVMADHSSQVQRSAGIRIHRGAVEPSGVIQRDISVEGEGSKTAGYWANKYVEARGGDFGRALDAGKTLDGEIFSTEDDLFDRMADIIDAGKDRARQPLAKETAARLVALEIDYYFDEIKEPPMMQLNRTYESNWDKKGGFGCEYIVADSNKRHWVLHVHRGPNGGLKAASVKTWDDRKKQQSGTSVLKLANVNALGVPEVSMDKKEK
jgi:hypothetical protein